MYIPVRTPKSLNFVSAGVTTTLLVCTATSLILLWMIHLWLYILVLPAGYVLCRFMHCCYLNRNKISQWCFDGLLRFILEASADMVLFSFVSIAELESSSYFKSITASLRISWVNIFAHIVLLVALPVSFIVARKWWQREESRKIVGSLLEGTDHSKPERIWSALAFVFIFVARRVVIGLVITNKQDFLWAQVSV